MKTLKIFFLSILSLLSLFTFTQVVHAQDEFYGLSPALESKVVHGQFYPWNLDTSDASQFCQDYMLILDMSQVKVNILNRNMETFAFECVDPYGGYNPTSYNNEFLNYSIQVKEPKENIKLNEIPNDMDYWCFIPEYPGKISEIPGYKESNNYFYYHIEEDHEVQIVCQNNFRGFVEKRIKYTTEEKTQPTPTETNPTTNPPNTTTIQPLTPPTQIDGCMDTLATNYNANATVHVQNLCEYPQVHTPQDITGSFEKSQVTIGATAWTLRFNLNVANATLDPNTVQNWNQFTAISATTNDKTITLTLRQFDDQRLDVECNNYEVTIPANAIRTPNGDTNANPISGNFEVIGCGNTNTNNSQNNNTGTGQIQQIEQKYTSNMNDKAFYVRLFDIDDKGNQHLNLGSLIFVLGFSTFFLVVFFLLFAFIKNSFLGKSKR